jgi:hypothetical protein
MSRPARGGPWPGNPRGARWSGAGAGSPGEAARPDRIDERLYLGGRGLSAGGEVGELTHETNRPPGPFAKMRRSAQVDGLGRDEELEGDDPRGEVGHLGEAPC